MNSDDEMTNEERAALDAEIELDAPTSPQNPRYPAWFVIIPVRERGVDRGPKCVRLNGYPPRSE